jgi:heme A synthase
VRVATLFRAASLAVLVQIALGGLLTFAFTGPLPHIAMGSVVFILAVAAAVVALRSKPSYAQLKQVSVALIAALSAQVLLGFTTLAVGSDVLAWIHLVLGVLIYAMVLSGMFFAQRQEYASKAGRRGEQDGS